MTSKGDLLKPNLYLYIIIYRDMKSIKDLGKLIENEDSFITSILVIMNT